MQEHRKQDQLQLVAFRLGAEEYAIPIEMVESIIKLGPLTSSPRIAVVRAGRHESPRPHHVGDRLCGSDSGCRLSADQPEGRILVVQYAETTIGSARRQRLGGVQPRRDGLPATSTGARQRCRRRCRRHHPCRRASDRLAQRRVDPPLHRGRRRIGTGSVMSVNEPCCGRRRLRPDAADGFRRPELDPGPGNRGHCGQRARGGQIDCRAQAGHRLARHRAARDERARRPQGDHAHATQHGSCWSPPTPQRAPKQPSKGLPSGRSTSCRSRASEEGIDVFRVRLRRTFRAALSAKLPQSDSAAPPAVPRNARPRPSAADLARGDRILNRWATSPLRVLLLLHQSTGFPDRGCPAHAAQVHRKDG